LTSRKKEKYIKSCIVFGDIINSEEGGTCMNTRT
jgi:hypothetical protein